MKKKKTKKRRKEKEKTENGKEEQKNKEKKNKRKMRTKRCYIMFILGDQLIIRAHARNEIYIYYIIQP